MIWCSTRSGVVTMHAQLSSATEEPTDCSPRLVTYFPYICDNVRSE